MKTSLQQQLPRLVTGLALAAVLVACLVFGGLPLVIVLALVSVLALYEFFQLLWPGKTKIPTKIFGLFLGLMVFCPVGQPFSVAVILLLAFLWAAAAFLADYGRGNDGARLAGQAALPMGIVYIPLLLHLALTLSVKEQFLVVTAASASDTAADSVGGAIGRHKLWPRVSPKKSWEGSLAGFIACLAVTVGIACIPYGGDPLLGGNILVWLCIGAILGVAAQVGDFFESALKRAHGVKDSSTLLPGHGGILDRIDSILFSLAAYCVIRLAIDHAVGLSRLFAAA